MKRRERVPVRSCLGCSERSPQMSMVRVVHDRAGRLVIDRDRRAGGRGGYLHPAAACWAQFAQRKGPIRSLGATVDRAARVALVAELQLGLSR